MPLPEIPLDDRRFEDLVADVKRRIPAYTPEWTDLNDSDPGITLIHLFAWLEEMLLWRLNRVPEKNFIKFLELLGIELKPPVPAKAELTFKLTTPDPNPPKGWVVIPQGTKVSPSETADGAPVVFETDENLYAIGGTLVALQSYHDGKFELLDTNPVAGRSFFPLGPEPQKDAAFYLGFDRAFPSTPEPHVLTIHAFTEGLIEKGKGIGANFAQPAPPVNAAWEYWADIAKWRPLRVVRDETGALARTGRVLFEAPTDMKKDVCGLWRKPDDPPLFWLRFYVDQLVGSGYEIAPRLEDVLINTIGATSAQSANREFVGASDGTPNQRFRLANQQVLPEGLALEVDEGKGFEPWEKVADFGSSKRTDKHYILKASTGDIAFGDGEQGKIPGRLTAPNRPEQDLANIRASYRWGGGAGANVGAKKITSLQSPVPFVDSVTNMRPATGGDDEETVAEAKARAPESIRTQTRAVTPGDFEFLARETPGARIRRAHAIPLHHPDIDAAVAVPGVVTIAVVPESIKRKPLVTEETLALVARWLNDHRLITAELYVVAPKYRKVEIEARVVVEPNANSAVVEQELKQKLLDYFHPLKGGTDKKGWDFGGTIYFSETFRRIFETPGVLRVESGAVKTYLDDKPMEQCQDIVLNPDELVYSEDHRIFVRHE